MVLPTRRSLRFRDWTLLSRTKFGRDQTGSSNETSSSWKITYDSTVRALADLWTKPSRARYRRSQEPFLRDVLERVKDVAKHDDIYLLIASGEVYVDLGAAAIVEPERVRVFTNAKIAAAYQRACPDLEHPTFRDGTPPEAAHSEAFRLLTSASDQDLKTPNERFADLKGY